MMPMIFNYFASENKSSYHIFQIDTILLINYKGNKSSGFSTIKPQDVNHPAVL